MFLLYQKVSKGDFKQQEVQVNYTQEKTSSRNHN